jgi:arginyl-tRNA synthetase
LSKSTAKEERIQGAEKEMVEKGLTEVSEGAVIVDSIKRMPEKVGKSLDKALV